MGTEFFEGMLARFFGLYITVVLLRILDAIGEPKVKKVKKKEHIHKWGEWEDPRELATSTSFNSSKALIQVRRCLGCKESESKEISRVSSPHG